MKGWQQRQWLNGGITAGSVLLCLLLTPTRLPGVELLGIGPNWTLMWVVAWSIKRTLWHGILAGLALGLIQDGMIGSYPTHTIALVLVGFLSARLQKPRYIQEDFISVALVVFGMVIVAETVIAISYSIGGRPITEIWHEYQRLVLASAILSSLWAPILYYPLNRWWGSQTERRSLPASPRHPKIKI